MITFLDSEIGLENDDEVILFGVRGRAAGMLHSIVLQFPTKVDERDTMLGMDAVYVDFANDDESQQGGYGLLRSVTTFSQNTIRLHFHEKALTHGVPDVELEFLFDSSISLEKLDHLRTLCVQSKTPFTEH
jgi:hypothetical protein